MFLFEDFDYGFGFVMLVLLLPSITDISEL